VVRLAAVLAFALLLFPPRWWMGEAREEWAFVVTHRVRDRASGAFAAAAPQRAAPRHRLSMVLS
jgi:hypothetical protein